MAADSDLSLQFVDFGNDESFPAWFFDKGLERVFDYLNFTINLVRFAIERLPVSPKRFSSW